LLFRAGAPAEVAELDGDGYCQKEKENGGHDEASPPEPGLFERSLAARFDLGKDHIAIFELRFDLRNGQGMGQVAEVDDCRISFLQLKFGWADFNSLLFGGGEKSFCIFIGSDKGIHQPFDLLPDSVRIGFGVVTTEANVLAPASEHVVRRTQDPVVAMASLALGNAQAIEGSPMRAPGEKVASAGMALSADKGHRADLRRRGAMIAVTIIANRRGKVLFFVEGLSVDTGLVFFNLVGREAVGPHIIPV